MSGGSEGEKPSSSCCSLKRSAEELCRKAKETLEKANKLLAESGKKVDSGQNCEKGETS